jgi:hypothetical protein
MPKDQPQTSHKDPPKPKQPAEPYRYENGEVYEPPAKPAPPFIPDQGYDGPA